MHTVMWTFKVPAGTSKAKLVETIKATARQEWATPMVVESAARQLMAAE